MYMYIYIYIHVHIRTPSLHLEIDPRREGEINDYEKEGGEVMYSVLYKVGSIL